MTSDNQSAAKSVTGKWMTLYPDERGAIHVLPDFGRGHDTRELGLLYWCCPRYEWTEHGTVIVIHECDN